MAMSPPGGACQPENQAVIGRLHAMLDGAMRGRTLYVVSYLMGLLGSPLSKVGIEVTDSIYVALCMGIMTRMGVQAYEHLGPSDDFNRGLHSRLDRKHFRKVMEAVPEAAFGWLQVDTPPPGVVAAEHRFAKRRLEHLSTWKPAREDLATLRDLVNQKAGRELMEPGGIDHGHEGTAASTGQRRADA
jgi:hypothetical protein